MTKTEETKAETAAKKAAAAAKKAAAKKAAAAKAARGVTNPTPKSAGVDYDRTNRREKEAGERERPPGRVRRTEEEK